MALSLVKCGCSFRAVRILAALLLLAAVPALLVAQDATGAKRAKSRGRLPDYYARVVTEPQKDQVYSVQAKFEQQIDELEAKILELEKQRDDAVRAILTPEQRKQVDALAAEAKAKRDERRAAAKEAEATTATPASTTTTAPAAGNRLPAKAR